VAAADRIGQTGLIVRRPTVTLRAPLLAMALAFGAVFPAIPASAGQTAAQARSSAETIIQGLRREDSQAIYDLLSPDLQRSTTLERVKKRLKQRDPILSIRIKEVLTGADDSTVEAVLVTAKGSQPLILVLDEQGRLLGWETSLEDTPIEKVASNFVTALSEGKLIEARALLSSFMQTEISPQDLLNRWKDLEKLTGSFQRIRGTVVASEGGEQQLVLVTTQFSQLTDNLFVILDPSGHIIGVDFPEEIRTPGVAAGS